MGILDNIEKGIERAINTVFARTFRSGLQPLEILTAIKRELDRKATILGKNRTVVPHAITLHISPEDHQRLSELGAELMAELKQEIRSYAEEHSYSFLKPLIITLVADSNQKTGVLSLDSAKLAKNIALVPALTINGTTHKLRRGKNIIGRSSEADIVISDTASSRKHLELNWLSPTKVTAKDLETTNGTKLNGLGFKVATLNADSVLQIGRTSMAFHFVPQEEPETQRKESSR